MSNVWHSYVFLRPNGSRNFSPCAQIFEVQACPGSCMLRYNHTAHVAGHWAGAERDCVSLGPSLSEMEPPVPGSSSCCSDSHARASCEIPVCLLPRECCAWPSMAKAKHTDLEVVKIWISVTGGGSICTSVGPNAASDLDVSGVSKG